MYVFHVLTTHRSQESLGNKQAHRLTKAKHTHAKHKDEWIQMKGKQRKQCLDVRTMKWSCQMLVKSCKIKCSSLSNSELSDMQTLQEQELEENILPTLNEQSACERNMIPPLKRNCLLFLILSLYMCFSILKGLTHDQCGGHLNKQTQ